ncbi:phage integrase N-terminal domain-containing protein [Janthinobacterium sp. HLS12-2]
MKTKDRKDDFAMRDLNYQLKQLCHRNRDGSFATQADRERLLNLCANDLAERGFQHMSVDSLKPKHVAALLDKWKQDGVSTGTIKNRMSALRWWAEKIGKENIIARSNGEYGISAIIPAAPRLHSFATLLFHSLRP